MHGFQRVSGGEHEQMSNEKKTTKNNFVLILNLIKNLDFVCDSGKFKVKEWKTEGELNQGKITKEWQ